MSWTERYTADPLLEAYAPLPHPTARILVHSDFREQAAAGLLDATAVRVDEVRGGREAHPVLELPDGTRVVARRYRRGGALRHLNRGRYFRGHRALEELRTTVHAAAGGVRAPLVIAAVERPGGVGYTATLLTRLVPGARELAGWLADSAPAERPAVLHAAGEQIARMHAAGVAHPDLNLRNFLVSGGDAPEVWIIDFDRATAGAAAVAAGRRGRDLRRLQRSIRKIGVGWGRAEGQALREGYGAAWPLASPLG